MFPEFVETLGSRFTHEQYLHLSRIQGTLWTSADIVIAWCLLHMGNLARASIGRRLHRVSYALLLATIPPAAYIPFVDNAALFFRLELAVTIPHFLIILYVCAADARPGYEALRTRLVDIGPPKA